MKHSSGASYAETRGIRPPLRRRTRITLLCLAVIGVLLLAAIAWIGVRGMLAKNALQAAVPLAARLQSEIVAGDSAAATRTQSALAARVGTAADLTSDPIWKTAEHLPLAGTNLAVVRELAQIVEAVSTDALAPLTNVADKITLSEFKPVDGAINIAPLSAIHPQVSRATQALASAREAVTAIDTTNTLAVVADATATLRTEITSAAEAADAVNRAVTLLPAMLGGNGPRNYLLMFQNPAELRATGGITGALALVHTEKGRVTLAKQASSSNFPHYKTPVLPLAPATVGLYGEITGEYIQDVNLTPQFDQSAKLAQEMWKREFGVTVDGVLSIDPVTLSYLLRATGPLTLPTGDVLNSSNAVSLLLSEVYQRYDRPQDQDAFFAGAAASVFAAVSGGDLDPAALIGALARAGEERRILLWSTHPEDQAVLAATTLSGGLPVSTADQLRFGVYFNDATGAKMDYYLDTKLAVGQKVCRNDKRANYAVEVTLKNTAPADAAASLKPYVTGGGGFGVTPGNIKTIVIIYGPTQLQGLTATQDDDVLKYHLSFDSGHQVATTAVELAPGQSTVLHFNWLAVSPSNVLASLVSTPIIHLPETQEIAISCQPALG